MSVSDSLPALFSENSEWPPRVMILGSSPGIISQQQQRYYAHPRNSFWWIMSQILSFDVEIDYESRVRNMTQSGIFLWDVLKRCERQGSLDASIVRQSEQVNDLETILKRYKTLVMIGFNGKAAHATFKRHFPDQVYNHLECHVLPSTSPTHASMDWHEKLLHWQIIENYMN